MQVGYRMSQMKKKNTHTGAMLIPISSCAVEFIKMKMKQKEAKKK